MLIFFVYLFQRPYIFLNVRSVSNKEILRNFSWRITKKTPISGHFISLTKISFFFFNVKTRSFVFPVYLTNDLYQDVLIFDISFHFTPLFLFVYFVFCWFFFSFFFLFCYFAFIIFLFKWQTNLLTQMKKISEII